MVWGGAVSPTLQLESLTMALIVDIQEKRDMTTVNMARSYLLVEMDDRVFEMLRGEAVYILCRPKEKYTSI